MKLAIQFTLIFVILIAGCGDQSIAQPTSTDVADVDHSSEMIRLATDALFTVAEPFGGGGAGGTDKKADGGGMITTPLSLAAFCVSFQTELSQVEGITLADFEGKVDNCESKWVMVQEGEDWLLIVEIESTDQDEVYEFTLRTIAP